MKVLLYNNHHQLPFWHHPKQSTLLFDPVALATWVVQKWTPGKYSLPGGGWASHAWCPDPEAPSATEDFMWPILCGLHALDMPFLAHVSSPFVDGRVESLKRAWVQFSTIPDQEVDGIPLCIVDEKPVVTCLWGWDNGTYSPYELAGVRSSKDLKPEHKTPEFWTSFFLQVLQNVRQEQIQAVEKLELQLEGSRRLLALYDSVADNK